MTFILSLLVPPFPPSALPDPIINVTTVGSTEAGQTFSLVCNVTMATEETPRPTVTWIKVTGGSKTFPEADQAMTSLTVASTISFSPLTFSHRGQYRCMVTLNISTIYTFAGNESYDILVDCEYSKLNYMYMFSATVYMYNTSYMYVCIHDVICIADNS